MLGRLIGLEKCPGVQQILMGETWRRMIAKCVLTVMGEDSKEACGTEQGVGIRDRGGYSRGAAPVSAAHPGGGLGVSNH